MAGGRILNGRLLRPQSEPARQADYPADSISPENGHASEDNVPAFSQDITQSLG